MTPVRSIVVVLVFAGWPMPARADDAALDKAIERSIKRVEDGAASYTTHRECFSCHHQALSMMSLPKARENGFKVDGDKIKKQLEFSITSFKKEQEDLPKGSGIGGGADTIGYGLAALEAAGHKADDLTLAMVQYLLKRQRENGSWAVAAKRPPSEASPITTTAMAVRGLIAYGPKEGDVAKLVKTALEKAGQWLLEAKCESTEDHVFRLFGLLAIKADAKVIDDAKQALLKLQREDGGWSQLPEMDSDAYATGTALVALRAAGLAADDEAFKKGVTYLLKTQREDGAWIVETRSRPIQTYFDNGDPGEKSQFISFAATNWALMALLEAKPAK